MPYRSRSVLLSIQQACNRLLCIHFRMGLEAEATQLEVQTTPGQAERTGSFGDISPVSVEIGLDHLALQLIDCDC